MAGDIERDGLLAEGKGPLWVYTNEQGKKDLEGLPFAVEVEQSYEDFRVGRLSLPFLNPKLRHKTIGQRYLLKITPFTSENP